MVLLRIVADAELRAIGRNQVIVVAARGESGVEHLRRAPSHRNFLDAAIAIEEQVLAIRHPVGRLEALRSDVNDAAVCRIDRDHFKRAVEGGGCACVRCGAVTRRARRFGSCVDAHVREHRFLDDVRVVAAHADADVKRFLQRDARRAAGELELPVFVRQPH